MSSKNFILLALTFTSLIHFKFISVYDIKYKVGIQLYSFTYEYQVSPAIFVEPHSFIHWIVLHPWCKTISFQYIHKSLLLGSLLYFIGWCLFLCKYNAILSSSVSSVAQSCLTLCSPMDCSTRGLPAHHQLPELAQTPVVMSSNHLILCHPLLLLPSIFPSIRVFSSKSTVRIRWTKFWSFSFSLISPKGYQGLISLLSQGLSRVFSSMTAYIWEWLNIHISYTLQCHRGQRQRQSASMILPQTNYEAVIRN